MKAILKNYRQSPRKVRLITTLISGKPYTEAIAQLDALPKRGAAPIKKLLVSAASNAKHNGGADEKNLMVKSARVDKAIILRRWMPRMGGRAARILKRSSTIVIELGTK